MEINPRFNTERSQRKVYNLKKALYALAQFSEAWFDKLCQVMISSVTN